jgi:hypothetical protein
MPARRRTEPGGPLNIEEVRLVSDLRIMHSQVDELHQIVDNLKRRHSHKDIFHYAGAEVLADNIRRVDETYLWFVNLKEETERQRDRGTRLLSYYELLLQFS